MNLSQLYYFSTNSCKLHKLYLVEIIVSPFGGTVSSCTITHYICIYIIMYMYKHALCNTM